MKAVSIYEKNDWDIQVQYGTDMSEIKWATRWLHILVDMKTYDFIINWKVEEVQGLCMRLLIKDT